MLAGGGKDAMLGSISATLDNPKLKHGRVVYDDRSYVASIGCNQTSRTSDGWSRPAAPVVSVSVRPTSQATAEDRGVAEPPSTLAYDAARYPSLRTRKRAAYLPGVRRVQRANQSVILVS